MIPPNIRREHILLAIQEIDIHGVLPSRASSKYNLRFDGKTYPPKYVISLANKFANGKELNPQEFSGGQETNGFLKQRGFQVEGGASPRSRPDPPKQEAAHNERCPACKATVKRMLAAIYGGVEERYAVSVSTNVEDYRRSPWYPHLREIFSSLQQYRGYRNFVRTPILPACDFFVPQPGFIVEFDESQHFTPPRVLALQSYPQELAVGFSVEKWLRLCQSIHARDNDPPFRDEQRAWYDTLRDFLPAVKGLGPTVRLYAADMRWRGLDPEKPADQKRFKEIIDQRAVSTEGWVATVVLQSNGHFSNEDRLQLLSSVLRAVTARTTGDGVIIFPAGWFQAGPQEAKALYGWVEAQIVPLLQQEQPRQPLVCVGVDGRKNGLARDQIGLVLTRTGIIAIGRKFYPTEQE
jgi:hypothetical protein